MGAPLGGQIKEVQTFNDNAGNPAYYVVRLNPAGLVFVPADDLVEPIIGFLSEGVYDPSPTNPLGALVSRDIPGRVLKARETETQALEKSAVLAPQGPWAAAQRKWTFLENPTAAPGQEAAGFPTPSDMRVAPFVLSRWSQTTVGSGACYNYYTPKYGDGNPSNYPCGCTATAMAQVMRYWQHPVSPMVGSFTITVDGKSQSAIIRGGSGSGGSYDWANMVLDPNSGVTDPQRQAIGALTSDAGLSVGMNYTSSSSSAWPYGTTLVNTFKYSNAKFAYNSGNNFPDSNRNAMINPSLNAQYPVIIAINGPSAGHAIVGDGYGYNNSTMYHHLNMGWAGSNDAWYNLPNVNTTSYTFNSVYGLTYNIYTSGTGEIIAGRVTDAAGNPIAGATVTATGGGHTYLAVQKNVVGALTPSSGVYAIPQVPSGATVTVSASKAGYSFASRSVTTGTSLDNNCGTGNLWGVDFVDGAPALTLNKALDNARLSFATLGDSAWYPQTTTSYYGGSVAQSGTIGDSQSTSLQTTVMGPGTLSFYWKVSSESGSDFLDLLIDSAKQPNGISGEVDWTRVTKAIPAGTHTIIWRYRKNYQTSSGSDCGWVEKVVYLHPGMVGIYALLLN